MKGTKEFYNRTAVDWAEHGYSSDADFQCCVDFIGKLKKGSRVLDLCCGAGYDSGRIKAMGYEVIGIDFSEDSLRIAKEKNPTITFYNDNILNDYSYIGKVDALIVKAGLVHVETADLKIAFERMSKVLNDSGYIFVTIRDGLGKIPERSVSNIDGELYDRNFIAHTLEELITESENYFSFVEEVGFDGTVWRNYIFRKI